MVSRVALGDYDFAVKDATDYLRLFGKANADDADEVTFLLGQAHEKAKKKDPDPVIDKPFARPLIHTIRNVGYSLDAGR